VYTIACIVYTVACSTSPPWHTSPTVVASGSCKSVTF